MQTERDKARVLDGLEGAAAAAGQKFDRGAMEQTLAGLGNRVFLMNNVHEDEPVVFESRWALSYLRGPLTRSQIKSGHGSAEEGGSRSEGAGGSYHLRLSGGASEISPMLPPDVPHISSRSVGRSRTAVN